MKPARRSFGVLLAVAAGLVIAQPGAAQSTEERLGELRRQYQAAVSVHDSARTVQTVVYRDFNTALGVIARARGARDDAELSRAFSSALARAAPLGDAGNRVAAAADRLRSLRRALIDVLVVREIELIQLADAAASDQESRDFDDLRRVVSNELATLEDEVANDGGLDPVPMPDITSDPRDGPAETLGKAEILERRAARVDTLIMSIDDEIRQLRSRRDIERRHLDLIAGTGRFGDLQPPTGTTAGTNPAVQPTDSTAIGGRALTLDERIEALGVDRRNLLEQRDLLLVRARGFRARVRSRS